MLSAGDDRRGLSDRAHSSVCSTSARVAFVSSVAWWRACSSRRAPRASASRSSFARLAVRVRDELAGLVAGCRHDLVPLALALVAVALDVGLPLLQVDLLLANFLLGARELSGGRVLGVALEDVGELGRLADQMERIHADGVPGRVDLR